MQLAYLTARGRWYDVSWKGVEERSGGIVTNIGIHFFDLLVWLFGEVKDSAVHLREPSAPAARMTLANADVEWYLSAEAADLPFEPQPGSKTTFRAITVDGKQLEFSEGFTDLHTRVYQEVIDGRGFGISDARPSIELSHRIRHAPITDAGAGRCAARASDAESIGTSWRPPFIPPPSSIPAPRLAKTAASGTGCTSAAAP